MSRAGLAGLVVAFCEVRSIASSQGVEPGREFEVSVALVEVGSDRIAPRDVLVDVGQCPQPCGCTVGFTDGDGTVEPDDRRVGESEQLVVPLHDLHPVGVLEAESVRVERGDRRLCLVLAEPVLRERGLQDGDSLCDELGVPLAPVLLGERHDPAVRAGPTAAARVVQQHQGEQAVDLGVVDQGCQLAGEPDRLGRDVDIAGVALVEDEVQHSHHGSHVAGAIETSPADRTFGAADPLGHRALGDEVGLRDLCGGETAHRPEREGDRR